MDRQIGNKEMHLSGKVFNNDAILRILMTKLDLENLKKLRNLNCTCFLKTRCCWMKRAWVHVRNHHVTDNRPLTEFTTFFLQCLSFESGRVIPVQNFSVRLTGIPIFNPNWNSFFTVCGPHIKSLEIEISGLNRLRMLTENEKYFLYGARLLMENVVSLHLKLTDNFIRCVTTSPESVLIALFPSASYLPHLKRLQFSSSQTLQTSILRIFANPQKLILRTIGNGRGQQLFPDLFHNLWAIRRSYRNSDAEVFELKTLDIIGVPKSHMEKIIEMNLPLEHLALSLRRNVQQVDVANLLDHYDSTLISLKLLRSKNHSCTPLWCLQLKTHMTKLNVLELWGNMVTNLNFLRSLPSLMKLKVEYFCFECPYFSGFSESYWDKPAVFQGDMVANSSVLMKQTKFKLDKLQEFVTDCKMSVKSWDRLTKWMPNLRVLEAPVPSNTALLDVCDRLEKLEKLRVRFGSDIDDDGILSDPVTDQDGNMTFSRGITKLTQLRTFEMEVDCGQTRLLDISAEQGFLKLKHLGTLKLGFIGDMISEEMERRLRDSIGHFEMYRSCSKTRRGGRARRCCQWADFKRKWRFV